MKLRKTLAGILGAVVMLLGVGTFEHVNRETGVKAAEGDKYVKVTSTPSDWIGDYLIVYEGGNVAFNGGLSSFDAINNGVSVSISNGEISATEELNAAKFTISAYESGYSILGSSGKYIGATSYSNSLVSSTTEITNTLSIDSSGNANISVVLDGGTVTLKYNNASNQNRFRYYKSGQQNVQLYKLEKGDIPVVPETPDYDKEVNDLFSKYYNNGAYVKKSVLNTNITTDEEIAKYFHAKANVKERTTWYNSNGLTMYTDETDGNGISTYENKNGVVYHTGLGGNWTVNTPVNGLDHAPETVEEMFITLKDFVEANSTGWEFADGVYTYNLSATTLDNGNVNEDSMTTMAREFVAPMWLAPTTTSYAYVKYTKLTVQEVNEQLVMKLYVHDDNKGLLEEGHQSSLVLSEISINKANDVGEYLTNIAPNTFKSNGETVNLGNINWTITLPDGIDPSAGTHTNGQQFGTGTKPANTVKLTSNETVFANSFSITTSGASDVIATFTVKIGETIIADNITLNDYVTDYKFEIEEKVYGKVSVEYTQTSSKAIYIKTLALNVDGFDITLPDEVEGTVYAINYEGNEKTFKVTPEEGYRVSNVIADNAAVTVDGNTFTLSNIVGNTSIEIEYEKIPTYNVSITGAEVTGKTTEILEGTPVTYTVTVPEGKIIKSITANEQAVGFDGNTFTLTIMSNTNVVVTLEDAASQPISEEETLNIFGTTGTMDGTDSISWTGTNFTVVNAKGSTAIRTSDSDHYRLYKDSKATISGLNGIKITKIIITCTSSSYANVIASDVEGENVSGSVVTIVTNNVESFTFTLSAQSRIKSIKIVYYK